MGASWPLERCRLRIIIPGYPDTADKSTSTYDAGVSIDKLSVLALRSRNQGLGFVKDKKRIEYAMQK